MDVVPPPAAHGLPGDGSPFAGVIRHADAGNLAPASSCAQPKRWPGEESRSTYPATCCPRGAPAMRRMLNLDHAMDVPLTARLNFWECTGSLRYNLLTRRVQPFVDLGYGLSWYRLENLRLQLANFHLRGTTFGTPRWVRKPGCSTVWSVLVTFLQERGRFAAPFATTRSRTR